ncbi:hypothetical protein IWQ60_012266 [Tieghemiomyces parasiticus]|uniref:JAB1/MPN/MOV34 metalloenzyme domain-containing protein n=1 Tax=Tieghemiomyces parasiticus TaxID=78921 RepID=A0A9W7ZLC8_9FUNG|nr:hypothetical protein IWQ60_012266 [Tieghemiomyces parasiticus]
MSTSHSDLQPATGAAETDVLGSTVAVHPLVLISANDHLTRVTVQHTPSPPRVYGAVLGSVEGRVTHLRSAFELHVSEQADVLSLDTGHLLERYDMARQVFPDHDLLGWYCAGPPPGPAAVAAFHMQFRRAHDSTLVLLVDPAQLLPESAATDLPLRALEAVPSTEGNRGSSDDGPQFEERTVAVVSEEDERIAAEQLLTDTAGDYRPGVQLMQYLQSQRSAVELLRTRLQLIQRYLRDVQTGK